MSLELCILASGSAGNSAMLRTPAGVLLIDAGLGPRTTALRMNNTGVALRDIRAIVLTHLDSDHFNNNWGRTVAQNNIKVYCHQSCTDEVAARLTEGDYGDPRSTNHICAFEDQNFSPLPDLTFAPISLAHDSSGSHGFVIKGHNSRVGYATDLGYVPRKLVDHFHGLHTLCIESNYDPQMQEGSDRPDFLKRRITSGKGHLSNQQAFEAVQGILNRAQRAAQPLPTHIVLLHRSRQCNCPKLLRKLFEQDKRIEGRLTLTEQHQPTAWLRTAATAPAMGEQLCLAWGA